MSHLEMQTGSQVHDLATDIPIHPTLIGDGRRGSDPEEARVGALNDEDDYVSRVSRGELEFMSSLNSARFLPCSLH